MNRIDVHADSIARKGVRSVDVRTLVFKCHAIST
jgi:hypothetical protein